MRSCIPGPTAMERLPPEAIGIVWTDEGSCLSTVHLPLLLRRSQKSLDDAARVLRSFAVRRSVKARRDLCTVRHRRRSATQSVYTEQSLAQRVFEIGGPTSREMALPPKQVQESRATQPTPA